MMFYLDFRRFHSIINVISSVSVLKDDWLGLVMYIESLMLSNLFKNGNTVVAGWGGIWLTILPLSYWTLRHSVEVCSILKAKISNCINYTHPFSTTNF